jgi:hypothetical protein
MVSRITAYRWILLCGLACLLWVSAPVVATTYPAPSAAVISAHVDDLDADDAVPMAPWSPLPQCVSPLSPSPLPAPARNDWRMGVFQPPRNR